MEGIKKALQTNQEPDGQWQKYEFAKLVKLSAKSLRSSKQIMLQVPVSKLKSSGDGSFSVADPVLWNRLTENVKSAKTMDYFKSLLKTYLFDAAFNSNQS